MTEPGPDTAEIEEAEKAVCGFVVSCRGLSDVFRLLEATLDHVAQWADSHVEDPADLPHRYHWRGATAFDIFVDYIGIIAPAGHRNGGLCQLVGHHQIMAACGPGPAHS